MEYTEIALDQRGPVLWLYLNRPQALNSLTKRMVVELAHALQQAASVDSSRVIALSGRGRAFCAGTDLKAEGDPNAAPNGEPTYIDLSLRFFAQLRAFPKPVIAVLNGTAVAGGMELAFNCDLIYAARSAKVGDGHSNFGLLPGAGNSVWLTRLLGPFRAKQLMFSGEIVPVEAFAHTGLVSRIVDDESLESEVQAMGERLATKSSLVLRRMKELVRDAEEQPVELALQHEFLVCRNYMLSHDFNEGIRAFSEKRAPQFRGY